MNPNQPNYNPYNQPPPPQPPQYPQSPPPQPPYQPPPQNNYPPQMPPPPMNYGQDPKSSKGALKIILIIAIPLILLAVLIGGVVLFSSGGNDYSKAGISCKEGEFDSSEIPLELREEIESAIGSTQVCSYEDDEWDLYNVSRLSKALKITYSTDETYSIAEFCDDEPWQGETVMVGSEVFSGANAYILREALEDNGFKVSDFKPDFC